MEIDEDTLWCIKQMYYSEGTTPSPELYTSAPPPPLPLKELIEHRTKPTPKESKKRVNRRQKSPAPVIKPLPVQAPKPISRAARYRERTGYYAQPIPWHNEVVIRAKRSIANDTAPAVQEAAPTPPPPRKNKRKQSNPKRRPPNDDDVFRGTSDC